MTASSLSLKQLSQKLASKELSAVELTQSYLDRIAQKDGATKAFVTVTDELAIEQAQAVDDARHKGESLPPLAGIPFSMKDAFCVKGVRTTAGAGILSNFVPPYDSSVYRKLREAQAVLIGKTNQDAFGHGSSTEHSAIQQTHNPWNLDKVPGGSSGGAAVSVAADFNPFAIGEDTGGSIRQPASLCGITGLKVTYGRVSRYGATAYASSLDTMGPMGRSVEDVAMVLEAIAGPDDYDATTVDEPVPAYSQQLESDVKGLKIGIPKEYFAEGIAPEVKTAVEAAIAQYEKMGAEIVTLSLPSTDQAVAAYYLVAPSETSSNLARYDGVRYGVSQRDDAQSWQEIQQNSRAAGFGEEGKRRVMVGTYALSSGYYDAYYKKAMQVRTKIRQELQDAFTQVDLMITPVSPFVAWDLGAKLDDPLSMWLVDAYTVTINPSGVPALALPCGFSPDKLPIGMQLIGPQFSELKLMQAGHAYQQVTDWHLQKPEF